MIKHEKQSGDSSVSIVSRVWWWVDLGFEFRYGEEIIEIGVICKIKTNEHSNRPNCNMWIRNPDGNREK